MKYQTNLFFEKMKRIKPVKYARVFFWISFNFMALLFITNFVGLYFSPQIVPKLPQAWVADLSSCYRIFHLFDMPSKTNSKVEFVFGDSFTEGLGDEYLGGEDQYGLFRKLSYPDRQVVIYGRSGFGNLSTLKLSQFCGPLIEQYTNFSISKKAEKIVTFVFYEGNDLYDNIKEFHRKVSKSHMRKQRMEFLFPLFYLLKNKLLDRQNGLFPSSLKKENSPEKKIASISQNGIEIPTSPQGAVVELSEWEFQKSIDILFEVLEIISMKYTGAKLQFLYLPAVATIYPLSGPIPLESRKNMNRSVLRDAKENEQRSLRIRKILSKKVAELGWTFCDTTTELKSQAREGQALHGPYDWRHFNKTGYEIVSQVYRQCFSQDEGHLSL